MKKLLLLVDKKGNRITRIRNSLQEEFGMKGKVEVAILSDVTFNISETGVSVKIQDQDIRDFNFVWFRRVGDKKLHISGSIALVLDYLGIKFIDQALKEVGLHEDKLTNSVRLALAGLPVPPTFFCFSERIEKYLDLIEKKFGYPLVMKEIFSQRGQGVFLIKNRDDVQRALRVFPDGKFLFQRFYPNDEEYRLLVLGNQVRVFERKIRMSQKEFRSNVALGAAEKFFEIQDTPKEMKEIAEKSAQVLGIGIAGVDILVDKKTGKKWILEVNRGPGLTYDPKISPELPELAKFFAKELGFT